MPQTITVSAAPSANYNYYGAILIVAVIAAVPANQHGRTIIGLHVLVPLLFLYLIIIGTFILPQGRQRKEIAIVVFPLGLQQVTRDEHGHDLSVPRFWPASDVLDCIVMERILVHTVRSVVCLRIRDRMETTLVEAFPGATPNSYEKCLELRAQILNALGRRTNFILK